MGADGIINSDLLLAHSAAQHVTCTYNLSSAGYPAAAKL